MNLREAAKQALEAMENVRHYDKENLYGLDDDITALRAALAEDRSADTGKTSDHFADAGEMVATSRESRHVEPVAWRGVIPGGRKTEAWESARIADYNQGWNDYRKAVTAAMSTLYTPPPKHAQTWTDEHWTEYERGIVAAERERIAAWVEDMCAGLDAKTIANGIRNGGNDDIGAFEVKK